MPCQKKGRIYEYDPSEVAAWLIENGHANRETWFDNLVDLATAMGVNRATAYGWRKNDSTFPYYLDFKGPYCLEVVEKWHKETKLPRHGRGGPASTATLLAANGGVIAKAPREKTRKEELEELLFEERLRSRRIENDLKLGKLVFIEEVAFALAERTAVCSQLLGETVGKIISCLPAVGQKVTVKNKKKAEHECRITMDLVKRLLAEALRDSDSREKLLQQLLGNEE